MSHQFSSYLLPHMGRFVELEVKEADSDSDSILSLAAIWP
jgi:hypothetical protein